MPITLTLVKSGGAATSIAKRRRIESGIYVDFMQGNKLVVDVGDQIVATAGDDAAFDVVVSALEGVA